MMALKIMQTSILFMLIFWAAIKFHGEDEPADIVQYIEAAGFGLSFITCVVSSLFVIWQY